ncbi:MAG: helix-turn-helix domain-containing protein [Ruminococcus sp.]|nr:helix-turn-helix domain-containing protein [Ruminococcus sp.]
MDYDINYIETSYNALELNEIFIKEFIRFRRENNLTQELFSKYSKVPREKIARIENGSHSPSVLSLLKIIAPIGYTIKIVKVENDKKY